MEGVFGDPVKRYNLAMADNIEFHIKVSYLEIYMEKIRDLLDGMYDIIYTYLKDFKMSLKFIFVLFFVSE